MAQPRLNDLGHLGAEALEAAITETYNPVKSYNTRAIRRLSVLSNVIPPSLKGAGIILGSSGGHAHVVRLTNARLDVLAALQSIGNERRARYMARSTGGALADGYDDELEICIEGFRAHVWTSLGQLIPIPLSDACIIDLYHTGGSSSDSGGVCALTGVCPIAVCTAVAAARARALHDDVEADDGATTGGSA